MTESTVDVRPALAILRKKGVKRIAEPLSRVLASKDPITRERDAYFWLLQAQKHEAKALGEDDVEYVRDLMAKLLVRLRRKELAPQTGAAALYASAAKRFAKLRDAATRSVVTWQWSKGDPFSLEPCSFELDGTKPGRWLKAPPKKPGAGFVRHGRDARGEIVISERHDGLVIYVRSEAEVVAYVFEGGSAVRVERYVYRAGRLELSEEHARYGMSQTRYEYDKKALCRMTTAHWDASQGRGDRVFDIEHDDVGVRAIFEVYPDASRWPRFERPVKGESIAQLLADIEPLVLPYVRAALARVKPKGPVFALALFTESEGGCFLPPGVAVGTTSELPKLGDPWFAEGYAQFGIDGPLPPELLALGRRIDQHVAAHPAAVKAVEGFLDGLARELQAEAAQLPFSIAADFVVYVYDVGGANGLASVRKLARGPLLKRLERAGLLPVKSAKK